MTVLRDLSQVSREALEAMVRELAAKANSGSNGIKIFALGTTNAKGEAYKGTVGVRTGRHYTILYPQQWLDVMDKADDIRKAIEDNKSLLAWKE